MISLPLPEVPVRATAQRFNGTRRMKILVVDDEQDICEILQYNLETEGYEVLTANSAEEAMEIPVKEYGLILLDVMMGEMSGFQLARRLKENLETAQIPIIFITALDNEGNFKGTIRKSTLLSVYRQMLADSSEE